MQNGAVLLEFVSVVGDHHDDGALIESQLSHRVHEDAEPMIDIEDASVVEGLGMLQVVVGQLDRGVGELRQPNLVQPLSRRVETR